VKIIIIKQYQFILSYFQILAMKESLRTEENEEERRYANVD